MVRGDGDKVVRGTRKTREKDQRVYGFGDVLRVEIRADTRGKNIVSNSSRKIECSMGQFLSHFIIRLRVKSKLP